MSHKWKLSLIALLVLSLTCYAIVFRSPLEGLCILAFSVSIAKEYFSLHRQAINHEHPIVQSLILLSPFPLLLALMASSPTNSWTWLGLWIVVIGIWTLVFMKSCARLKYSSEADSDDLFAKFGEFIVLGGGVLVCVPFVFGFTLHGSNSAIQGFLYYLGMMSFLRAYETMKHLRSNINKRLSGS